MVEFLRVRHHSELAGRFDDVAVRRERGRCLAMNPWIAKALVLAGTVVLIAIRAPHGHRSRMVKIATSYKTARETGLLVLAWVGFFVPLVWVASPAFAFAEYALGSGPLAAGAMCLRSASGSSTGRTLTLVPIGRSPWRCASSIDSSPRAFIAVSAIRCTWR